MEAIFFLIFWLGGATLHTIYELKIKPARGVDEQIKRTGYRS